MNRPPTLFAMLALVALALPSFGQTHVATASSESPFVVVPGYTGTQDVIRVDVTVDLTLERTLTIQNFDPSTIGSVTFGVQSPTPTFPPFTFVSCVVSAPSGGFLATKNGTPFPVHLETTTPRPLTVFASQTFANPEGFPTQRTFVNTEGFPPGRLTFPVRLTGSSATQYGSGDLRTSERWHWIAVVRVTYVELGAVLPPGAAVAA